MDNQTHMRVQEFLSDHPDGIIVIFGPTGSGKSKLAVEVSQKISGEVISVDARQIYQHMNIGTGKITTKEMQGIPHHMLDIRDPSEDFSVVDFRDEATPILTDIRARGHTPILCGGTGLYLDSLIYEREYLGSQPDKEKRSALELFAKTHGNMALWNQLAEKDPTYAEELHPNSTHAIIRAIEIYDETGLSKREAQHGEQLKYPTLFLTPYHDSTENRKMLYEKINARVSQMFEYGLIEEVCYIIYEFTSSCPGLDTIGYREVLRYLDGVASRDETISLVQKHSRNYAKRQITWNKKYEHSKN